MITISERVKYIEPSRSIGLATKVQELKNRGLPILSLIVGEPDMPPPREVMEEMLEAQLRGEWGYGPVSGTPRLRELIAKDAEKTYGMKFGRENVLVSNGSKQILYNLFQTILNPGDEVIIPIPYWVTFPESVKLAGGKPVLAPSLPNHHLDLSVIRRLIGPKTRAIILNSPNNPSGAVYGKDDLVQILNWAKENNFLIISDEAYAALVYEGTFTSPMHLHQTLGTKILDNVAVVQTFSKAYAMTGHRVGHIIGHPELIKAIDALQGHVCGNVCTPAQAAAAMALTMNQEYFVSMKKTFAMRRELAFKAFNPIFPMSKPEGAFYLFPNCQHYYNDHIRNSNELANYILEQAHVALLPGQAFGLENHLRISFAAKDQDIIEAATRISKVLKGNP